MKRFRTIGAIINLDSDQEMIFEHVNELIQHNRAEVTLICLLHAELDDEKEAGLREKLEKAYPFVTGVHIFSNDHVLNVCQLTASAGLDMLLIEPRKRSALQQFFYGSTTVSLIRNAPCAVWVTKRRVKQSYERILIAIDAEAEEHEKKLNTKLIQIGTSYAQMQGAECHLATSWHLAEEYTLESPMLNISREEIESMKLKRKMRVAEAFEKVIVAHKDILQGTETHFLEGEPGEVIADYAKKNQINLVILGTLARSGVKGFVIGNTAETIINHIDCSIMAIKPDDFTSLLVR